MPPFMRLVLPVIIGIALARVSGAAVPPVLCFVAALMLLSLALLLYAQRRRRVWHDKLLTVLFYLFVALCAVSRYSLVHQEKEAMWLYERCQGQLLAWVAEIDGPPVQKQRYIEAEVRLLVYRDTEGIWRQLKRGCRVLLRIQDSLRVHIGDRLLLKSQLATFAPPSEPDGFDYRLYMHNQNIYLSSWAKAGSYVRLEPSAHLWQGIRRGMALWQEHLKRGLSQAGLKQSAGVLLALSLGDKSLLQQDTKQLYADTGASHVLAVSGLHVGILFLLMQWLWQPARRPALRWAFLLTTLPLLWGYALLTGASPSVLRASLMFSLFSLASCMNRTTNAYNTLALSAFLLLLLNPMLLFHLSFQLSYMAVLGILFFYPRLSGLWQPRFTFLRKVYELMCVSLAAQLTTLPLTLLYFGQLPLAGLPSSLLVVPPAPFLLLASFLLALLMLLHAPTGLITLLSKTLLSIQGFIETALEVLREALPPIAMPYWNTVDSLIVCGLLLLLVLYLTKEMPFRPFVACSTIVLVLGSTYNIYKQYALHKEARMYVWYNARHKHCEVWLVKGREVWRSEPLYCNRRAWRISWKDWSVCVVNAPIDTTNLWTEAPDILVWNSHRTIPSRYVQASQLFLLGPSASERQEKMLQQASKKLYDLRKLGVWSISENSPIE